MDTIEVNEIDHDVTEIICPFCNKKVVDLPQDSEADIKPCEHMLFVATDYGFEYCSPQFLSHMGVTHKGDLLVDGGIDECTSNVTLLGSIKYASYIPAPSFMGTYYGFAPKT